MHPVESHALSRPHLTPTSPGTKLRVARLLAFAHYIDTQIRDREIADLADAARQTGLTRARVTQVMNLLLLAPAIQEALITHPTASGRDPITERALRRLAAEPYWVRQIEIWNDIMERTAA